MAQRKDLEPDHLVAFGHTAAGHDGAMSDPAGELFIKPCTAAEIAFYQQTLDQHPDFAELMPEFMGTLQLGVAAQATHAPLRPDAAEAVQDATQQHAAATHPPQRHRIATETAIALGNLEHGFTRPNVLDVKLGARLYADDTAPEKAARLDKVAAETTSGPLHFRVSGMKVWNGTDYDIYDKQYGRAFTAETVQEAFATFFAGLVACLKPEEAQELLETMLAEIGKVRHTLTRYESRIYSSSILIVYEGDGEALKTLIGREPQPMGDERAPTAGEVKKVEEEEDEDEPPVAFKLRMIDFAHAAWTPGQGKDENVLTGLENMEKQMDQLIARYD